MFYIEISGKNVFFGATNGVDKNNIETFNTEDEMLNRLKQIETANEGSELNIFVKNLVKVTNS